MDIVVVFFDRKFVLSIAPDGYDIFRDSYIYILWLNSSDRSLNDYFVLGLVDIDGQLALELFFVDPLL